MVMNVTKERIMMFGQVNPDSTGWELGIRNPTMGTIQGVCISGRELATRVLVTVGDTVVTATYLSRAHRLIIKY